MIIREIIKEFRRIGMAQLAYQSPDIIERLKEARRRAKERASQ